MENFRPQLQNIVFLQLKTAGSAYHLPSDTHLTLIHPAKRQAEPQSLTPKAP
jgi:hypothetical protein